MMTMKNRFRLSEFANAAVNFLAVHPSLEWGIDPDFHSVRSDPHNGHTDDAVKDNRFTDLATEYQHRFLPSFGVSRAFLRSPRHIPD
jgi:hypothetical protein